MTKGEMLRERSAGSGRRKKIRSAQQEIIHCRNCEKYGTKFCAMDTWTDQVTIRRAKPDDFCSKIEKRGKMSEMIQCDKCKKSMYTDSRSDADISIEDMAEDLEKITDWVPVGVRPPKDFESVYVQDRLGSHMISKYIPPRIKPKNHPDGYWGDTDYFEYDYFDMVAWHPLPKPYKVPEDWE